MSLTHPEWKCICQFFHSADCKRATRLEDQLAAERQRADKFHGLYLDWMSEAAKAMAKCERLEAALREIAKKVDDWDGWDPGDLIEAIGLRANQELKPASAPCRHLNGRSWDGAHGRGWHCDDCGAGTSTPSSASAAGMEPK